jgi:hypothetical protein
MEWNVNISQEITDMITKLAQVAVQTRETSYQRCKSYRGELESSLYVSPIIYPVV